MSFLMLLWLFTTLPLMNVYECVTNWVTLTVVCILLSNYIHSETNYCFYSKLLNCLHKIVVSKQRNLHFKWIEKLRFESCFCYLAIQWLCPPPPEFPLYSGRGQRWWGPHLGHRWQSQYWDTWHWGHVRCWCNYSALICVLWLIAVWLQCWPADDALWTILELKDLLKLLTYGII